MNCHLNVKEKNLNRVVEFVLILVDGKVKILMVKKFKNLSKINCKNLHKNGGIYDSLTVGNYWYNINTSKDQNHPHTHPGSILSGIIYLNCPLNCSPVIFLNPNHLLISSYINSLSNLSFNSYLGLHYIKQPNNGDLIIFPSWLEHYVPVGNYEGERISLSFNVIKTNETN